MTAQGHRAHVRGVDGVTHDVRVWYPTTAACGAVVFNPPRNTFYLDLAGLGSHLIREGVVVDDPIDCMPCLAARRTPYAVLCDNHGQQFLTLKQYDHQMSRPNSLWMCPRCGESAHWDDDEYQAHLNEGFNDDDDEVDQRTDRSC